MYNWPTGDSNTNNNTFTSPKPSMHLIQDAWSHNQITSKMEVCRLLEQFVDAQNIEKLPFIFLLGGWYGILAFMLRVRENLSIGKIESFDIDHAAVRSSDLINNKWEYEQWAFKAHHKDANRIYYNEEVLHCVINTSSEHFDSDEWFTRIPTGSIVCLQSTDMEHDEHINCVSSIEEFTKRYPLNETITSTYGFSYPDKKFSRFTMVGIK